MADTVNGEPARSGPDRASTLGLVLDGGLGRRMGGADKGFVTLAGRPMLANAIERLRPQCESLAISANGDATRFASFGLPVIADDPRSVMNSTIPLRRAPEQAGSSMLSAEEA